MFVGHYGLAFAAKRLEPRLSLVGASIAAQLVDLLFLGFALLGVEQIRIVPGFAAASHYQFVSYPLSHSLVAALVWAVVAAAVYYSWPTRDTAHHTRRTVIVMLLVASHWFLDLVVHVPDLPLAGDDSPKLGLGLYQSIPATLGVELGLLALGIGLLVLWPLKRYHPRKWRLVTVGVLLALGEIATVYSAPAPSVRAMLLGTALTVPVVLALLAWADRPLTA
jgi:hypothetical protein